jgi:hypothetical protein
MMGGVNGTAEQWWVVSMIPTRGIKIYCALTTFNENILYICISNCTLQ